MKTKKILIFTGIIVFLGLAAAVSFGTYQLITVELARRPSVQFLQPVHEQSLPLGDSLVRFIARDKEGIEHVELWVDGELYASKKSELPQGSTPFPFVELWQPESAGQHVLTARAYNSKNRDAVVSIVVQVSEEASVVTELPAVLPFDGEGAEVPAPGDGVPPGDAGVEAPAAAKEEADEYIPMLDNSIEIEPLEGFLIEPDRPILDMIPKIRLPGDSVFAYSTRLLEVEALYLETEGGWDGVFCYLTLPGYIEEHIPDLERDGIEFIRAGPGNSWDIQSLLGRENSRIVYLDGDALTLDIELQCYGAIFERGTVYDLGTLNASHPSSDWDGHTIEETIPGPDGWFRVGYRINPAEDSDDGMPAPILGVECSDFSGYANVCYLRWSYPDEARETIDGFIIQMNGSLQSVAYAYDNDYTIADTWGTYPPCSETFTYKVYAYQEDPVFGTISPASNPISLTAAPCYDLVTVTFEDLILICLSGDASTNWCGGGTGDVPQNMIDWWPMYRECPYIRPYDDSNGCSYGTLWANDKRINIGEGGGNFVLCREMADSSCYEVENAISTVTTNKLWIPLDAMESLVIGMNWYDNDRFSDDRQCYAEYQFTPRDLQDIAARSNHRETYLKYFNERGGGSCALRFTIHAIERTPPSDE